MPEKNYHKLTSPKKPTGRASRPKSYQGLEAGGPSIDPKADWYKSAAGGRARQAAKARSAATARKGPSYGPTYQMNIHTHGNRPLVRRYK